MKPMESRRVYSLLTTAVSCAMLFAGSLAPVSLGLTFDQLCRKARNLSEDAYQGVSKPNLPDPIKDLPYDAYQQIEFLDDHSPWADDHLRFEIGLYHLGYLYKKAVSIHLIEDGEVRSFPFSPNQFRYHKPDLAKRVPGDLGFAGVQIFYPLGANEETQAVASFLGATYFRIIGQDQRYGASARGLAIDTAEPSGEEFPRFTDYWIKKPGAEADYLTLFALLDSPSLAGAYRFVIRPGRATQVDVRARLFPRETGKKLGIAPLTSMFLTGENRTRYFPDFRPEVHDSDGLLLHMDSDHWIWRPLTNPPKSHHVDRITAKSLHGFGLLQRDRRFHNYQDLETRYELHPSLWITPQNEWGPGTIELVEIPTDEEGNDNIVAYWVFDQDITKESETEISYTISACLERNQHPSLLRVKSTRLAPAKEGPTRFIIDFSGPLPADLASNASTTCHVETSRGNVEDIVTQQNPVTGGRRATFKLSASGAEKVELRAFLRNGKRRVSETWLYHFRPH